MLRIATLNLNYYIEKHGPWPLRKKLIAEQLRSRDPHVIALQAVARHPDLYDGKDQALQLYEDLNGFQSHYFQEAQTSDDGTQQGNAVIATLPMIEKSFEKLTLKRRLDDTNHRIVTRTSFKSKEGSIDLYNAHFSWVEEQSIVNVEEAVQFMERGNSMAVLAGDLNTAADSIAFLPFEKKKFADAWHIYHKDQSGYTFESDNPSVRIDYFWLSPAISNKVKNIEILSSPLERPVRLSDHLGLLIELDI
jgi:endonuclease/exonuclease/phosphatase family metal-dependent hydrolase